MPIFEANSSKIKMVILTKSKQENAVWWSPINQNKRPNHLIMLSMLRRFEKHTLSKITNVVQFYENGQLIASKKI